MLFLVIKSKLHKITMFDQNKRTNILHWAPSISDSSGIIIFTVIISIFCCTGITGIYY